VVCFSKDVKVPVKVRRTLSLVGTSSSNTLTPDKSDPVDLLRTELNVQHKQLDLIMKQNSTLLAAMAKGNGSGGDGGSGGGS
jgi:hypothetical protein